MSIDRKEFEIWKMDVELEYASRSIPRKPGSSTLDRLKFITTLNGGYKVTLGSKTLYEGGSFDEASCIYNEKLPVNS